MKMECSRRLLNQGGIVFVALVLFGTVASQQARNHDNCSTSDATADCCLKTNSTLVCKSLCPYGFYNTSEDGVYEKDDTHEVFKETTISTDRTAPISTDRTAPISTDRTAPISTDRTAPISTDRTAPDGLLTNDSSKTTSCSKCDESCAGCHGPGADDCDTCAEGYGRPESDFNSTCSKRRSGPEGGLGLRRLLTLSIVCVFAVSCICFLFGYTIKRRDKVVDIFRHLTTAKSFLYEPLDVENANNSLDGDNSSESLDGDNTFQNDPTPIFSSRWQTELNVDGSGGRLQKEMSDIVLIIPQGAILGTERVVGAVYTHLDNASKKLGLPESECIVSPIAEYHTPVTFRKPVKVVLPHFLPPSWRVDTDRVYVYQIDGKDGKLTKTKLNLGLKSATGRAGTFCIDDDVVRIFTDHFTAFVVCADCQKRSLPETLLLDVWAKHIERDTGLRLVEVRLYVWIGAKFYSKDIRADLLPANDLVNFKGMKATDLRPLDRYPGPDPDVTLRAKLTLPQSMQATWRFKDDPIKYPASVEPISLDDLSPCACQHLPPYKLRMWQLTNERDVTPEDLWQGSVIVSYVTKHGDALSNPQPIGDPEGCNSGSCGGLKQAEASPYSVITTSETTAPQLQASPVFNFGNVNSVNITQDGAGSQPSLQGFGEWPDDEPAFP